MEQNFITEWLELKQRMAVDKAREEELRIYISNTMLSGKVTGSVRTVFGDIELKTTAKQYTNVDQVALNQEYDNLNDNEKNALKYRPSFNMREYNKLPPDSVLRVRCGVVTQAKPSLEVVTG